METQPDELQEEEPQPVTTENVPETEEQQATEEPVTPPEN